MSSFEDVHCDCCSVVIARCFSSGHPRPSMFCISCAEEQDEAELQRQAADDARVHDALALSED